MQGTTFIVGSATNVDWLTAATGLLGVLLGAALSYFVTYQFERRRTRDDRLAKSYSLVFAIMKIAEDLTKMEDDVRTSLRKAKAQGVEGELWTKLTFAVGYPSAISIPSEDLTVVALARDQDLTRQVTEVEAAHQIYLEAMRKFQHYLDKFEALGLHTGMQEETVSFEADRAQLVQAGPTLIRLRTLSHSICEGVPRAARQAREVATRLGPHLKAHHEFKHFIELSYPEHEANAQKLSAASKNGQPTSQPE